MAKQEIKKTEKSKAERFTQLVVTNFKSTTPNITDQMADFHKRLCQNYFIKLDMDLRSLETKRLSKPEKKRDNLPITWDNVNLQQLALDVVSFARIGLDPLQKNHISFIPYKNLKTNQYDIGFIIEYRGLELKAKKYGLEVPDHIIIELVYEHDKFRPIKKSLNNPIENYEFAVAENAFNRGEVIGGFYYYLFKDEPEKNLLVTYTLDEILKRKPKNAPVEFWGGQKDIWKDGKKTGKEDIEGWKREMYYKTIYRAAYNNITIDSKKIDDDFIKFIESAEFESNHIDTKELLGENTKRLDSGESEQKKEPEKKEDNNEVGKKKPEQNTDNKGPGF